MKCGAICLLVICTLMTVACPKNAVEVTAYRTIVSANAFLKSEYVQHPECKATPPTLTTVCEILGRAVAAKDSLIDATEVYCGGPDFDSGKPCQAPTGATAVEATNKLNAAIANLNQTVSDIKVTVKGTNVPATN